MIPTCRLCLGDNLAFLRSRAFFPDESLDLVYLDPPFSPGRIRPLCGGDGRASGVRSGDCGDFWRWGETAERALQAFKDHSGSAPGPLAGLLNALEGFLGRSPTLAFLLQMALRLVELHRALKPTGALYLHCDPVASHHLRLLLDALFGPRQFQNEIVWCYRSGGATRRRFARKHDLIMFYAEDARRCRFNPQREKSYNRGLKPYRFQGVPEYQDETGWFTVVNMRDVWQIDMVGRTSAERVGYPNQKPLALLKRIVAASSRPGDLVLDPFCGCGTTIDAVETLNRESPDQPARRWIGIDVSPLAIELTERRLKDRFGDGCIRGAPITWCQVPSPDAIAKALKKTTTEK